MALLRPYFEIFKDIKREYRWKFVAKNGKTIAVSSEGYKQLKSCERSLAIVRDGVFFAELRIEK